MSPHDRHATMSSKTPMERKTTAASSNVSEKASEQVTCPVPSEPMAMGGLSVSSSSTPSSWKR
jgi:hypothetical protein